MAEEAADDLNKQETSQQMVWDTHSLNNSFRKSRQLVPHLLSPVPVEIMSRVFLRDAEKSGFL